MFENDEGEYVVLNEDTLCLRVAVLSSKTFPGTDIRRLKLKVFEGSSPTRDTGEEDEDKERQFALPVGVNVGEKSGPTSVSIEEPCSIRTRRIMMSTVIHFINDIARTASTMMYTVKAKHHLKDTC